MTELKQLNWQRDNFENIEEAWEGDLWDRERLGIQLTNYVDRLQCGAVLALDARWGEGKTWFVRHWKKHLENENHNVIYLDAFANDYLEDPFLVIASEIAAKLDKTADKGLVRKFKKAAAIMQQGLLTLAPTLIASMISCALTSGVIPLIKIDSDSLKDKLDDAIDKVTDNIGDKITEAIQNKIDSYEEEKNTVLAFKQTLAQLAESLDKPLVFIIDELDRCRPDFAIRLIERIKHFFNIKNIVFVLVVHKENLTQTINSHYGYAYEDEEKYLDKFIDFIIPLPKISSPSFDANLQHIRTLKDLLNRMSEDSEDICLVFYLAQFGQYYSPRQLKKKIHQYALLKTTSIKTNIFLVLALLLEPKKLEEKILKTVNVLEGISKNQDMSGFVTDIKRLDLDEFERLVQDKFSLNSRIYFELIKEIKAIETQNLGFESTKKEFNQLYQSFSLQQFEKGYFEFSKQFELYLNVHLQADNEVKTLE
jgi:hypothetical protein